MPDPLSITTGVLTLLEVTVKVAFELKKFHDAASVVNSTTALSRAEVESLNRMLESMRCVFESITAEYSPGHNTILWDNVARCIADAKDTLQQFNSLIQGLSKDASFLDEHRKQLRFKLAEEKIQVFRMHIQSYRDGLQLSLSAILVSNQTSFQRFTDQLLPYLSELYKDVRRIAPEINQRIELLLTAVRSPEEDHGVLALGHLRECVEVASTFSSVTTTMSLRQQDNVDENDTGSDFGDCFPVQNKLAMRRWIDSRTVYEYDEVAVQALPPESVADIPAIDDFGTVSDSDTELEHEMTQMLLERAKRKLCNAADVKGAEKMLRNCLGRLVTTKKGQSDRTLLRLEVVQFLYKIHLDHG